VWNAVSFLDFFGAPHFEIQKVFDFDRFGFVLFHRDVALASCFLCANCTVQTGENIGSNTVSDFYVSFLHGCVFWFIILFAFSTPIRR
jgi:hypothetical protein